MFRCGRTKDCSILAKAHVYLLVHGSGLLDAQCLVLSNSLLALSKAHCLGTHSHPSSNNPASALLSSLALLSAETPEIVPVNNGLHNCYFPNPQPVDQVCRNGYPALITSSSPVHASPSCCLSIFQHG